jgi:hypothetical protein
VANAFTPSGGPGQGGTSFGQVASNPSRTGQGMYPPGYGYGMYPPGYGALAQGAYPQAAGPMMPSMPHNGAAMPLVQNPYQHTAQPMMPAYPYGQGYQPIAPAGYYSPPQGYQRPAGQGMVYAGPSIPGAVNELPGQADPQQLLSMLRTSLYPSQREWAAEKLATLDWRAYPQVVQALIQAAKEDPAATVRAGCVRSLVHMNANTVPVVAAISSLQHDTDARVRGEVEQALARFGPAPDPAVQPAGAVVPAAPSN